MTLRFARVNLAAIFISALAVTAPVDAQESKPIVGISLTRPVTGRFVETDDGYMIPYTVTIPGTDVTFEMVPIPGGEFVFGSPESELGRKRDEGPQQRVRVEPFWMSKYEVRWKEYMLYMDLYRIFKEFESQRIRVVTKNNMVDAVTAPTELYDPQTAFEFGEDPEQPAVSMTQLSARHYTKWIGGVTGRQYRLPTEVEWEYACRAGSSTAFSCGDRPSTLRDYAWFSGTTNDDGARKVGLKKPNPWGLYDMHGNVAEWVMDGYSADGYSSNGPPFEDRTKSASSVVAWPTKEYPRAIRGGSWEMTAAECRSAARLASNVKDWKAEDPNIPLSPHWFTSGLARGVGFRMVRSLKRVSRKQMSKFWDIDNANIQQDVDDRIEGGRGISGLVDPDLPKAILKLKPRK